MSEPGAHGFYTPRASTNQRRFYVWMFAAMLCYLGATAAVRFKASVPPALSWSLVVLAWLLAMQTIRSYLTFLRGAAAAIGSLLGRRRYCGGGYR